MASGDFTNFRKKWIAGAAAGNIVVAGIKVGDRIVAINVFGLTEGVPNTFSGIADLTAEFKILVDGQINNTGGTSSAAKLMEVVWEASGGGRQGGRGTGRSGF